MRDVSGKQIKLHMARKEFIEGTYQNSKLVFEGQLSKKEAAQNLTDLGMKYNSAIINLNVFDELINGRLFKRTVSAPTFEYFLSKIESDFGEDALKNSLDALEKHIPYLEGTRSSKMNLVREIYQRYRSILASKEVIIDDEEQAFPEGAEKYKLHKYKERNRGLVIQAKKRFKVSDPDMRCQICQFSFYKKYGSIGLDFIEAHHVFPIATLTKETKTNIEDLAMVCSNCHRMLHVRRPWLGIDDLKKLLL
jgi:predicted HNH restriction endonuclease